MLHVLRVALVLTGLVLSSMMVTTAQAAPALYFRATPIKVVVNQSYEWIDWRVAGSGSWQVDYVSADLDHSATREGVDFDYDEYGVGGRFQFYDWNRMGRYTIHGEAYDQDYNELYIAPTTIMVKRQGRTTLTGSRSGGKVSLRAVMHRYDGGYPLWQPNAGATVRLQRRTSTGWRAISTRTVPKNGVLTWRFTRPRTTFRVLVNEAPTVWSSYARAITR